MEEKKELYFEIHTDRRRLFSRAASVASINAIPGPAGQGLFGQFVKEQSLNPDGRLERISTQTHPTNRK